MKTLKLRPIDQFYFSNHNNNLELESSSFSSFFPPRPNTVYGSLRSAFIGRHTTLSAFKQGLHEEEVEKWIGTGEKSGELAIGYMQLHDGETEYFPMPLDVQVLKEANKLAPLQLVPSTNTSAGLFDYMLMSSEHGKSADAADFVIGKKAFKQLLKGDLPAADQLKKTAEFITESDKVGIALDNQSRRAKDGFLYTKTLYSLNEGVTLNVKMTKSPDFQDIPMVQLGGGGKVWALAETEEKNLWNDHEELSLVRKILETRKVKFVLLSPAIWEKGSVPGSFQDGLLLLPNGLKVQVKTIASGRPKLYGGWDMNLNRPKKRWKMVPAGTVVYGELLEGDEEQVAQAVKGLHLSDRHAEEGFGYTIATTY